jgi:hypothetical protein
MKSERLIGSEHLAGGDAKQEGITDVPGGASHSDFDRSSHGAISHESFAEQSLTQNRRGALSRPSKSLLKLDRLNIGKHEQRCYAQALCARRRIADHAVGVRCRRFLGKLAAAEPLAREEEVRETQ